MTQHGVLSQNEPISDIIQPDSKLLTSQNITARFQYAIQFEKGSNSYPSWLEEFAAAAAAGLAAERRPWAWVFAAAAWAKWRHWERDDPLSQQRRQQPERPSAGPFAAAAAAAGSFVMTWSRAGCPDEQHKPDYWASCPYYSSPSSSSPVGSSSAFCNPAEAVESFLAAAAAAVVAAVAAVAAAAFACAS